MEHPLREGNGGTGGQDNVISIWMVGSIFFSW